MTGANLQALSRKGVGGYGRRHSLSTSSGTEGLASIDHGRCPDSLLLPGRFLCALLWRGMQTFVREFVFVCGSNQTS